MNQTRVRITSTLAAFTALAVAAVAVFAMSIGGISTSTAQSTAATIDVLNVGMCVATDADVFSEADCDDGDNEEAFTVAGRDELIERDTVYATYAHDPISSAEQPRGILTNSDLIKVTINDPGRDRRRSVIYPGGGDFTGLLGNAAVLAKIKDLLGDSVEDKSFETFTETVITVYNPRLDDTAIEGKAIIQNSGNSTLLFSRPSGNATEFIPLSEDEENDVVKWFGVLVPEALAGSVDASWIASNLEHRDRGLRDLGGGDQRTLIADEDRTEGGDNVAPWMAVNANIPAGHVVVIAAILYETSDQEVIQGGAVCTEDASMTGNPCFANVAQPNDDDPNFTDAEISNKTALVAEVVGDNGYEARNLYLTETDRFSGQYSGYIRLTDANGDGTADTGGTREDWGLTLAHGTASTPTVVGVLSEATIRYRDSEGTTRTFSIEVDIQPPTITVNAPLNDAAGDDRSPDFVGTFEDGGAGLAEDSFRLYVDNMTDGGEGEVGDSRPNLDSEYVMIVPSGIDLASTASDGKATLRRDYAAPTSAPFSFGVISGVPDDSRDGPYFATRDQADLSYNSTERKIVEADSYDDGDGNGTFDDDARFDGSASNGREIEVDFQAVVLDLAGNIGFSDADPSGPAFIDDLGEALADRDMPNVLGWYSAHIIHIDDKDPEVIEDLVVTGYYDVDGDGDPVPHRRGIMITFDNDIDPDVITTNTFTVELDDGTDATVRDVLVDKNRVFLRLDIDMASNETPEVAIGSGHRVEDFAGNQLQARELDSVEAKDGIGPNLVVTLGGGSGTGTGDDGPDRLTNNTIVVSISSDEALQGSPFVAVVCSNLEYRDPDDNERDVDDFIAARSGGLTIRPQLTAIEEPGCGGLSTGATGAVDRVVPTENQSFSRPGLNWEHTWRNAGGNRTVPDGEATVVVYARDRSSYALDADARTQVQNWGSASTTFIIDNRIEDPEVLPEPGDTVAENRPWISLNYEADASTVTIEEFRVDGVDVTNMVDSTQRNRFIYSPEGLDFGDHDIEVTASDSAGNEDTFDWTFEVTSRSAFVVRLVAGWNAISIPYRPVDGSIEAVFTNASIKQVIGYDLRTPDSPWKMALRQDNVWTTNFGELTVIEPGFGYWVHSDTFVNQEIRLEGRTRLDSTQPTLPIDFPRCQGWNLVGVVDQDADQTQSNDWNQTLKSGNTPQNAEQYLGNYTHAYVWDGTTNQLRALNDRDPVLIGQGIWAFYDSGTRSTLCPDGVS